MALVHTNSTVGTTVKCIVALPAGLPRTTAVQIQNNDTATIYIGDATVTTSGAARGHAIAANATFQLWLNANDQVYAISAAGTTTGAVVVTYSGI